MLGQTRHEEHRSGNVHDSHGAKDFFILEAIATVRAALPRGSIEVRMDSAFFSDEIIGSLDAQGADYTVSVPFERFAELKERTVGGGGSRRGAPTLRPSLPRRLRTGF